jgi:sporulation protein YlmC with PRC-barrel domain
MKPKKGKVMRTTHHYLAACAVVAGLTLGLSARADDDDKDSKTHRLSSSSECTASDIIGKKVKNAQDEDLGKVQDIVVNLDSGRAPYAIIAHGGTFGAGRTKTAVPLSSLRTSPDDKALMLSATKEQLVAASRTPSGAWSSAQNAEWARSVDGYYGEPHDYPAGQSDRQPIRDGSETREFVRDRNTQGAGAEQLMQPADAALYQRVSESIDSVQVRVENGLVKLNGQVASEAERKEIETKVRALPGVQRVESNLRVRNQ